MLIIDLRRLAKGPVEVSGEIAPDDPLWAGVEVEFRSPVTVQARAEGEARRGVWLKGAFAARIGMNCRRCLKPLELEISEEFEWLFDPKTPETDGDLTLYALEAEADELDLGEPIRERLLLAVPAFPSCPYGCRGLCGRCGRSLDEGECDCGNEESDPRWAPLEALRGSGGPGD